MDEQTPMNIEKPIDQARIGLAELDAEGCFLSANSSYLSMLGVQEADLLGQQQAAEAASRAKSDFLPSMSHEIQTIANSAVSLVDQCNAIPDKIAAKRPAFLANRRLDLEKMKAAAGARDFAAIKVIGHNCKGTGVGYGFPEISRLGSAIEQAAIAQDVDMLAESLRQFGTCLTDDLVRA